MAYTYADVWRLEDWNLTKTGSANGPVLEAVVVSQPGNVYVAVVPNGWTSEQVWRLIAEKSSRVRNQMKAIEMEAFDEGEPPPWVSK